MPAPNPPKASKHGIKPAPRLPSSSPAPSDSDNEVEITGAEEGPQKDGHWKRKYKEIAEQGNKAKDKKKSEEEVPLVTLGRGIYKIGFITGKLQHQVAEADKLMIFQEDPDSELMNNAFKGLTTEEEEDLKRNWQRSATAIAEISRFLPNFQQTIDTTETAQLSLIYHQLNQGAKAGRSDDLNRIKTLLAMWLNEETPTPSPLLISRSRANRGLNHDLTGRLLCPVEFDWDDLDVRAKLRAGGDEDFDVFSSFHASVFYRKFTGTPTNLEYGFLMSSLLVRVYRAIFTGPSSAADPIEEPDSGDENLPAPKKRKKSRSGKNATTNEGQRQVASIVNLDDHVTPRSIAYAAVMLHFNLQTAQRWASSYGGFNYVSLYNYIVDFFEEAPTKAAKERVKVLLKWWDGQIFPDAAANQQSSTVKSRNAMMQQRAACSSKDTSQAPPPARPSTSRSANVLTSSSAANSAAGAESPAESVA